MTNLLKTYTKSIKHWYIPFILGIIFIICGAYVLNTPLETYLALAVFFSISFIVSGLFDTVFSIINSAHLTGWGWYLVNGLLTLGLGIYLTVYPGITITILPFVVGFTLLFRSFQQLGFSLDLKEVGFLKWKDLAILSVLGIVFSFLLIANPVFSGLSIVVLTALIFIFVGVSSVLLGLKLKKMKDMPNKISVDLKNRIQALNHEISQSIR